MHKLTWFKHSEHGISEVLVRISTWISVIFLHCDMVLYSTHSGVFIWSTTPKISPIIIIIEQDIQQAAYIKCISTVNVSSITCAARSWTTIVVHSRDDQEVHGIHKVKSPEYQLQLSQLTVGQYWLGPNKFSDRPEMLSKSCHEIFKIFYLTEFSTDWLTD